MRLRNIILILAIQIGQPHDELAACSVEVELLEIALEERLNDNPPPPPLPPPPPPDTPVILNSSGDGPWQGGWGGYPPQDDYGYAEARVAAGLGRTYVQYSKGIDSDPADGRLDDGWQEVIDTWLEARELDYDGTLMLDWEGKLFAALKKGPSHPNYTAAVADAVTLITYVRQQRPNALVGYYGLPWREYWQQSTLPTLNGYAMPVMAAGNALFPSYYDFYGDDRSSTGAVQDAERFGIMAQEALRVAAELGGEGDPYPIYGYINNRWHPATAQWGNRFIPAEEIALHVQNLAAQERNGDKLDGFVCWNGMRYSYSRAWHKQSDGSWTLDSTGWDQSRAGFIEAGYAPPEWDTEGMTADSDPIWWQTLNDALAETPVDPDPGPTPVP